MISIETELISEVDSKERTKDRRGEVQPDFTKPRPLRVLLVSARYLPHVGGTEMHTYEVARRLASVGNDVTVLTTDLEGGLPPCEEMAGFRVKRVRAWPARRDYYFAPGIFREISQGNWDIIHCQGYHTLVAPIVMLAASRAKIPYVVTFHSGGHSSWLRNALRPVQRAMLRPLLARAEKLVGVSKWEAEFFRERLGLPAEKFTVIPNGSHLPRIENLSARQSDGTLIVSVGRLERYKGHHRVIAALPRVVEHCPGARLRIVGSGPYEVALRQYAADLGVAQHLEIRAISGGDRDGMASLLMDSALVILLSDYESQSISIMEALVLQRPVLVADSTALTELAASGLARATPLGSTPEEVCSAILEQINQPLVPERAELPNWDGCANEVLGLYHRVMDNGSACKS